MHTYKARKADDHGRFPRKEDKLRPYRVDYFDVTEMIDGDKALVRSKVVRAVTAQQAANIVQFEEDGKLADGRVIVKSARFYKKLSAQPKRKVYKAVEDLFTSNKAVKIMDRVEEFRAAKSHAEFQAIYKEMTADPIPCGTAALVAQTGGVDPDAPTCPYGYTKENPGTAHICAIHSDADYAPSPFTFPDHAVVPTTTAVFDDQEFVNKIDLDKAAPILYPAPTAVALDPFAQAALDAEPRPIYNPAEHGDDIAAAVTYPVAGRVLGGRLDADTQTVTCADCGGDSPIACGLKKLKSSLAVKIIGFSAAAALVVYIVVEILKHCGC